MKNVLIPFSGPCGIRVVAYGSDPGVRLLILKACHLPFAPDEK